MPQSGSEGRNEEAVVLTRAVENFFRKLVRFLIGRVSLVRLQELLRSIFVEETENRLRKENPSGNVTLTQLALLSGLDTRTLTKVRNHPNYRKPFHTEARFLQQFVVGASLLNDWSSKTPYMDAVSGQARVLKIHGERPSFESLFDESTKSRGVTYKSLLKRLLKSGIVCVNRKADEVSLVANTYLPMNSKDKLGAIEIGFSALTNLTDTVTRNICALESGGEKMFQRGTWTYKLREDRKDDMREELNLLLEETDATARKIIEKYEDSVASADSVTAGISLFYFEEQE